MIGSDWTHEPRIWTSAEAVGAVREDFEAFRDYVRHQAHLASGDEGRALREALVLVAEQFDALDDQVGARFGQPSPRAPRLPALLEPPEYVPPAPQVVSPTNRSARSSAFERRAGGPV